MGFQRTAVEYFATDTVHKYVLYNFVVPIPTSKYNITVQARDLHTGATVHLWRATVHP